jgi:hypothetical protein
MPGSGELEATLTGEAGIRPGTDPAETEYRS